MLPYFCVKNKSKDYGTEEIYYLGLIEKRFDKNKAALYFRSYLDAALSEKALNNNYILAAAEELSSLGIKISDRDKLLIGKAYYKNEKYKNALEYFSKLQIGSGAAGTLHYRR